MERPDWAPLGIDLELPSASRIYDYYLGGSHNFEVDREIARQIIARWPRIPALMRENRDFLRRATQYLVEQGLTQFVDLGSGIPTLGSVHEVVLAQRPNARIVYVDSDPVAVMHSRAILADSSQTRVVQADLRDPATIFTEAAADGFVDFAQPIGLIFGAVLHFVDDAQNPAGIVATFADELAAGSYVVISHASLMDDPARAATQMEMATLYRDTATPITLRTPAQIETLFNDLELVEPGLTQLTEWRPASGGTEAPVEDTGYAGVGRKP